VVTEGILTRMLQQDVELPGISLVIFDEFHFPQGAVFWSIASNHRWLAINGWKTVRRQR